MFNNQINILVIDDSKLNRAVIKKCLSDFNMDVTEAENGEDGIQLYKNKKFDLIIVDTVMPKMDGIEFIDEIKKIVKNNVFIPIILMTGSDYLNSKIKGLNIGADDFLQKPVNQKELIARVNSLLRLKRTHDQLLEKNHILESEMLAAKKIQQYIIPLDFSAVKYPIISGFYTPMEDIGGDFFDFYTLPNGNIGIMISDVTGHGIPAALIVQMTKMIFRIYAPDYDNPKELLSKVNTELQGLLMEGHYVTSFYIIYIPSKGLIRFSNAGHVIPLLYRRRTGKVHRIDTTKGFFLGIMEEDCYEQKAFQIEQGDRIIMYTDGLSEIKNKDKIEFGENGISDFLIKNPNMPGNLLCKNLFDNAISFSDNNIKDDISILNIDF